MSNNLGTYGYDFQIKLLVTLISDKPFIKQTADIIRSQYFTSDAAKWLANQSLDYYAEYKDTITFDVIKMELSNIESQELKTDVLRHIQDINKHFKSSDLSYVKSKTLAFLKNQVLKKALLDSIELLQDENYEEIRHVINEASNAGVERDIGHDYFEDFEDRYNESLRKCVLTSWPVIDDLLSGGIGAGELGVIVGGPGSGKSWFLAYLGAAAVKAGKKVLHYTLELSENYVGLRYDSIISGYPFKELKYHKDEVKELVDQYGKSLIVKQYPATIATVATLEAHYNLLKSLGFEPDLIIIDYGDLLTTTLSKHMQSSYHIGGRIYEEMRGFLTLIGKPGWTGSQSNRSAQEQDVIVAENIADSYKKVMTADFVMSISRKIEDKLAGTSRIHIIKNRFGADGMTFKASFNANNGAISIYDVGTRGDLEESKKQGNGNEYVRRLIAQKLGNMNKEKEKE